ncbi:MAG: hypothetical protein HYS44_02320 [Candidatus Niyogibacteria bacterium]|nr:hypothetical protein [Candidatus Niyogibacteria bacterium]
MTIQRCISLILLVSIVTGVTGFGLGAFSPKTAHAIPVEVVTDVERRVSNLATITAVGAAIVGVVSHSPEAFAVSAGSAAIALCTAKTFDLFKDCDVQKHILEPVGQAILKAIVIEMTNDIVNWINSGFEGQPLFVQDFTTFGLNAADLASGYYLESLLGPDTLAALCSPFRFEVIFNLFEFQMPRPSCTISGIIENVEQMYQNFLTGGWASFIAISTQTNNNAFGSFLVRWDELHARALAKFTGEQSESQSSQGFLSFKKCVEYNEGRVDEGAGGFAVAGEAHYAPDPKFGCARYENQTPGAAIANSLFSIQNAEQDQLHLADSLNAIISALLQQLILKPLIEGLRGSSGFEEQQNSLELQQRKTELMQSISAALAQENSYGAAKQDSRETIQTILTQIETLKACSGQNLQSDINTYTELLQTIAGDIQISRERARQLTSLQGLAIAENRLGDMDELEARATETIAASADSEDVQTAQTESAELQTALDGYDQSIAACPAP